MRESKLWFRESSQRWYTTIRGRQVCLGPDKKAAEAELRRMLVHGVGADMTLYQLMNHYLKWVESNRAEDTFKFYGYHLGRFGLLGKTLRVSKLKPFHVQSILDSEYEGASSTSHAAAIGALKTALNWGVKQGLVSHNPIQGMEKPTRNVRETFVPAADWPRLFAAVKDDAFKDYLAFGLSTGARPHEIRTIEAAWVEPEHSRIVIPRLQSKGKKRQRVIYLDPVALAVVVRRCKSWATGPIFRNRSGRPWKKDAILCRFKRLREKLEMPGLCATVLRHSYTHHKLVSGVDSLVVATLLSHVDGEMIATRYGHLAQNADFLRAQASRDNPLLTFPDLPQLDGPSQPA